ncbi:hypothetical protein CCACVL1_02933, partial [Corchorus capsularis]
NSYIKGANSDITTSPWTDLTIEGPDDESTTRHFSLGYETSVKAKSDCLTLELTSRIMS